VSAAADPSALQLLRLAFVCVVALLPACTRFAGRHWEETRQTVIEPINSALHRHLPKDVREKRLDAVLHAYATEVGAGIPWGAPEADPVGGREERLHWRGASAPEAIRDRYTALFALFPTIERAELRIHRIHWEQRDQRGYPAEVRWVVRGLGPGGERQMLDQQALLRIDRREQRWVITAEDITSRELVRARRPRFEVVTAPAGLDDTHDTTGSPRFRLIGDTFVSSGGAVADVDCDGLEDVALLSASWLRLYRNTGAGTFTDVTAASGLPAELSIAGSGLIFFDADNDGDPDLWVSGVYGDRFFRNEGCARFSDATAHAGLPPTQWSSMPVVADYDRDGLLDVYVTRRGDYAHDAPTPNWDARNGVPHSLYRNTGNATFADVTAAAGIHETSWGLAAAWGDYDDDGYPDLYVGNEFGTHRLYRNTGRGTFVDDTERARAKQRSAAMGSAWGDYDNDGDLDLFVTSMYANSRWALFHPDFPAPVPWYLRWVPREQVDAITDQLTRGSMLLRNNGDATFSDDSDRAGVRDTQWGWASAFLDYDNDGWLDVFVTNGMVTGNLPDDV
jgi:hypothetical protein